MSWPQMPREGFHLGPLIIFLFFCKFGGIRAMILQITFNSLLNEPKNYSLEKGFFYNFIL